MGRDCESLRCRSLRSDGGEVRPEEAASESNALLKYSHRNSSIVRGMVEVETSSSIRISHSEEGRARSTKKEQGGEKEGQARKGANAVR